MITDWLISCKDNLKSLSKISKLIQLEKEIALYILEGSDYLRNCNQDQRTLLQIRLSNHIELFEQHLEAAAKILNQMMRALSTMYFCILRMLATYIIRQDNLRY